MLQRKIVTIAALLLLAVGIALPSATIFAQEDPPTPSIPMRAMIEVSEPPESFTLVQLLLDFAPGTGVPVHHHGGPVIVMIIEGELTSTVDGEDHTFGPGDMWSIPEGDEHSVINATEEHARAAVSVLLRPDEPLTTFANPDDRAGFEVIYRSTQEVTDPPAPMNLLEAIVEFPPGSMMPPHFHGGHVLVTVLEGTLTLHEEEGTVEYSAGEGWYEPANHEHFATNEGDETVRVLATWMLPLDAAPTTFIEQEAQAEDEEDLQLVTARVAADLVQPGRVLMSARGNHWVYDSVPPLNGPNEEVNPLDGMLTALIACGMYIYEAVGIENEITVENLSASATGELDPRGVSGAADVSPRLRAFHVTINVDGPTAEEAAMMAEAFSQRCPIYTTLALSAPIEVINVVDGEEQEPFATEADPITGADEEEEVELALSMPSASGRMVEFGRSMMSARGNHWIFDSVPPINGPNEEVNPLDALVGALPACGIMVYEAVTRDEGIPLHSINATVEADLDPRGVAGAPVNPRIRAFRVTMNVDGPTMEEAEFLADEFRARCPIYTTFERSAPIEITNRMIGEGTAVLVTSFTYDLEVDEYMAEVAPLAEPFAALDGMVWKIWTLDEENSRGGGIFLFEDTTARQAFLDGELFGMVQAHPALSDFKVEQYDVVRGESLATNGPLMAAAAAAEAGGEEVDAAEAGGEVLQITFTYNVSAEDFMAEVSPLAEDFAATEGLQWKIWSIDEANSQFSGILYFEDVESMDAFLESDLAETITTHPALSDFEITHYGVMAEESIMTSAPIQ